MTAAKGSLTVQVLAERASIWCTAAIIVLFLTLGAHASAGENGPMPSDWEKFDRTELTTVRAVFICLSDQPASWCSQWWESRATQAKKKEPEPESEPGSGSKSASGSESASGSNSASGKKETEPLEPPALEGKPKTVSDADWDALIQRVAAAPPNPADFKMLSLRASEDADPAAMEVLGYAYAAGWGVAKDYAEAYLYYGRAFLAGAGHVKPNLDQIWTVLTPEQQRRFRTLFVAAAPADSL